MSATLNHTEGEREAFEADAAPMGFDLKRLDCLAPESWSEYADESTGHRWGGWLARAAITRACGPLTIAQLNECARDAQIDFCMGKESSFEVAFARRIEAAHSITHLPLPPAPNQGEAS